VRIDGHDVSKVTLHTCAPRWDHASGQLRLFGTIADNIRYGKLDATMEEIKRACETVRASEFIEAMPRGYDTPVEEGGSNLSQGRSSSSPLPAP
jgi:ATP-binding cassette subfamily B protein